jgi:hypothetical protein
MSQKVSASASGPGGGSNSRVRTSARPRSSASRTAQEWCADQAAQQGFGVVDVAQVAGAVQAVHAGLGEFGEVADVVQPGGGLQELGVGAEGRGEAAGAGGDAPNVGPAAGQVSFEQGAGEAFGPRG